jgi:polar amino acid transport system permease protein
LEQFLAFLPNLGRGALTTLGLTVGAGLVCVALSFTLGIARTSRKRTIAWTANIYVEFFRGTSVLVQMFWIFFALPLFGIFIEPLTAGVLALGLNTGAYGAEIVRGAVQAVPRDQIEAAIALNYTYWKRLRHVVLPQALIIMLPPMGNLGIDIIKVSATVSLITISDLAFEANMYRSSTGSNIVPFVSILVVYYIYSTGIARGVLGLERKLSKFRA